ncbi:hypothetical protein [Modestobacter excelsi]|uniref:hypothetical protein n=1 Tax=Modestobacter excelsi TaxID=2213161 RepID=UPI001C20DADF|nr:hypothetical protein [Modestobacter excelsi]
MTPSTDLARVLLAAVRLTMGTAGLLAPGLVIRRLDIDPTTQPGMRYPLRMFGIRTVLIGAELLTPDTRRRWHAERLAPLVHGSDTVSAFIAWQLGDLPRRAGAMATAISAVNLVLSIVNLRSHRPEPPRRRFAAGLPRRAPRCR